MATNNIKREASTSRPLLDEDMTSRRKKLKHEDEEDDTDTGSEDETEKRPKSAGKVKGKKSSETHPHKCHFEGCERAYTRAEHLHRHQLEHKFDAKHFRCHFPDCNFGCVRRDLLDRHVERHNKQGSNLWRRDQKRGAGKGNPRLRAAGRKGQQDGQHEADATNGNTNGNHQMNGTSRLSNAAQPSPISPIAADFMASHPSAVSPVSPVTNFPVQTFIQQPQQTAVMNGYGSAPDLDSNIMSAPYYPSVSGVGQAYYAAPRSRGHSSSNLPTFEQGGLLGVPGRDMIMPPSMEMPGGRDPFGPVIDSVSQDHLGVPLSVDGFFDPFMQFDEKQSIDLMNDPTFANFGSNMFGFQQPRAHPEPEKMRRQQPHVDFYRDLPLTEMHDGLSETSADGPIQTPIRTSTPVHIFVNPESISPEKHREIINYIERKFEDVPRPSKIQNREREQRYFKGHFTHDHRLSNETHEFLTLNSLDMYLKSYWREFAPQIPIVHPSLDPNSPETECLLLLAMMAIGATSTDSGNKKAENELASFFAWNIRTRVLNHGDLVCPTETWILQTLVLIEAFEKLFSTRLLHERSHQLHGLTIELARRSECFEGPAVIEVDNRDLKGSWNKFIEIESRKRTAFTIFMTDAFHACMFSHKDSIRFSEIELAIPCSDSLWDCKTEGAFYNAFNLTENEVNGPLVTKRLANYGALHRQLFSSKGGQEFTGFLKNSELQQNKFSFKTLIAATISVYRDIDKFASRQNSLVLLSRLENWIKKSTMSQMPQDSDLAELYSLCAMAQINLRSNIVFLQQIACPSRILGKEVTNVRRNEALKQIRRWVRNSIKENSTRLQAATEAVCAAARYLTYIYASDRRTRNHVSIANYTPVGDTFLHRPWAVYCAILCIWAYAYTLEGPIDKSKVVTYRDGKDPQAAMAADRFLGRLMHIESPDQLKATTDLNRCLGLLTHMAWLSHHCQWELLREAGDRAEDAVRILKGESLPVDGWVWRHVNQGTLEEIEESKKEKDEFQRAVKKRLEEIQRETSSLKQKQEIMDRNQTRSVSIGLKKEETASRSESRGL